MRLLVNDPDWDGGDVNYVVLADTTQKLAGVTGPIWNPFDTLSGYTYKAPPVTPYDLTVVNYEYDGWADFPDRWWNQYAVYNAIAGGFILHFQTWIAGPDLDELNAVKTVTWNAAGGKTTTYLVHPETLPLVQLYPALAPMQDWLKEQIDAGYSRNDQTAASNSLGLRETASLATAPAAIEPDPQSVASTIDPSAGADAELVEDQDQSQKPVVDATPEPVDTTPEPVDTTPAPVEPTLGVTEAAYPSSRPATREGGRGWRNPRKGAHLPRPRQPRCRRCGCPRRHRCQGDPR